MAPNDRSGVRVGRKATAAGDHGEQVVMGGVGVVMGPHPDHTPHKDRPPDMLVPPTTPPGSAQGLRHTRRLTPEDRHAREDRHVRRVHTAAVALARKRSGSDDGLSSPGFTTPERHTKQPRGSPPPTPNGVKRLSEHLNGVVNNTTATILLGVSKDIHRNGITHLTPPVKNGIKCLNGVSANRINGVTRLNGAPPGVQRPDRVNGAVRRLSSGELNGLKMQQDLSYLTNNNQHHNPPEDALHPKPLLSVTPVAASLPHQPTTPMEAPTPLLNATPPTSTSPLSPSIHRAEQESLTSLNTVTIANTPPPVIGREASGVTPIILQQPQHQKQHKLSNALNGWLPRKEGSSNSSSGFSSGFSSSAPSSASPSRPPTPDRGVRFPAPKKKEPTDICRWNNCNATVDPTASLLEHIQAVHVEGQLSAENFRCLWVGCKVYDKASCSVSWLERHVLTHGGHKPFKCIVDGCGQRFGTQTALGRHVNHHFNNSSATPSPRPQPTPSPTKIQRKNGRKCRYRKKPWSARMFDFFDCSVMERIRWGLICVTEAQNSTPPVDGTFTCDAQVHGRRTNADGEAEVFVKWSPPDVLPDEWIPVDKFEARRSISLNKLSPEAKQVVSCKLYPVDPTTSHKHKRKRTTTSQNYLPLKDNKSFNI